jgi:hypothetical protein
MGLDTKTHWLTDRQSQCDFDFDLTVSQNVEWVVGERRGNESRESTVKRVDRKSEWSTELVRELFVTAIVLPTSEVGEWRSVKD